MGLIEFGENIQTLEGEIVKMFTIPFETRMTIVRLNDDSLWVHSPIAFNAERKKLVDKLGNIKHIVAPNMFHHLSLGDWSEVYPGANLWAAPGLEKKRKDLDFTGVLQDKPESAWEPEIDQCYFQGSLIFNEVVFFHKASKTLILTDLIQNHDPSKDNWFWKLVKRLNGALAPDGGVPKDLKMTIRKKPLARKSLDRILGWDFDKIIISHGLCIRENAKTRFTKAFSWLT